MPFDPVADAITSVFAAYKALDADSEERREQLRQIASVTETSVNASPRSLSDAAAFCLDRYVDAELDYQTAGDRGLGRMTDHIRRLAAKHRDVVRAMNSQTRLGLRRAVARHVACGYVWAAWRYELEPESSVSMSSDALLSMWVPAIYSPPFDVKTQSSDEDDIKTLWFSSTCKPIHDVLVGAGATWDFSETVGSDQAIVTHYFTAGMLLRMLEHRPLTVTERLGVVTGLTFLSRQSSAAISANRQKRDWRDWRSLINGMDSINPGFFSGIEGRDSLITTIAAFVWNAAEGDIEFKKRCVATALEEAGFRVRLRETDTIDLPGLDLFTPTKANSALSNQPAAPTDVSRASYYGSPWCPVFASPFSSTRRLLELIQH
ncbi:MAG TPA: hypothetical protein VG826_34920 [Pirellulales bacterium]|nr:hypothetical protein [Pirellulales bacterium]